VNVEQVDFLRVRSVPLGSTSHVDSNGAIVPGKAVAGSLQTDKKRKDAPSAVKSPVKAVAVKQEPRKEVREAADEEVDEVEAGREHKHKKEKKEKKEKKDKKDRA
jgi:hypothetical protein